MKRFATASLSLFALALIASSASAALRVPQIAVQGGTLQGYLNEYTFRWNHRDEAPPLFWAILDQVRKYRLAVD